MTVTSDARETRRDAATAATRRLTAASRRASVDDRPVEFWSTAAIRDALETDDLAVWQRIVTAIKRDPYGRTARQVEEVLEKANPYGVSKALAEVLVRTREQMAAAERAEVGHHVQLLLNRSGLGAPEFASRIGVGVDEFQSYIDGEVSPSASLMIRMGRLSERFAKIRAQRANNPR
ncbi:MAG: XRE family transcriptional regulator [Actinomycetota bacterium]|nr:XRE family transcriptional regulator [Actinomycetota bacterium]